MYNNLLSREMYNYLSWHVSEIEKERDMLLNEHYAEETKESINFQEFFKNYLDRINSYLNTVRVDKNGSEACPFVIINSIVEVFDCEEEEKCKYRIVLPFSKEYDTSIDCASCLSPLGRALLFKNVNDNVSVQIPTGMLHYTILDITLPDEKMPMLSDSTA
ncbi:MAG TPA: transcription elongation factor GreAB [Hungateiclostridium thermocellum]|uniref:Transcription elongation factor GreA/GreB domain-containing protein n=2 Tax=Acetivibrio thermocellus TaxID=1515 RepID=A3DJU3_ACET2|nr:GreA/GreB family elongation factor [Acetivibrio thermocellus]CDG37513.1 GreA/GreB family elongation factor [Acetivibrio thermocellus BC1]ABN54222.1 transcription elongation factor GreA/GreB domain-containing protein [Acetivibrio thermocellus ATCC 27405]ADU73659.1 transcription elongation factor GreA/GreB domain-containing protein [Acetivibrio thermocellus DSM 1313]ALX07588.1 GreA/GreB family elongation factor [Acetivibrio thermocellus AD2]ANV75328.1 GreA/GreB family elongation factor [Aceti